MCVSCGGDKVGVFLFLQPDECKSVVTTNKTGRVKRFINTTVHIILIASADPGIVQREWLINYS